MAGAQLLATGTLVLSGERVTLAPVEPADAAETARLMTPAISRMLTTWPEHMSIEQVETRIADSIAERGARLWTDWAIRLSATNALVGWIGMGRKDVAHTRLHVGIWLGEAFQGQRLGDEAVSAVMRLGAKCATAYLAEIHHDNRRSIGLFERLGFRCIAEGAAYSPVRASSSPSFIYERDLNGAAA